MALENSVCRFCLNVLVDNEFEIIENLKLGMLDVLLLKLNFAVSVAPLICLKCVDNLKQAFCFKTACLSVEQQINQFSIASTNTKVDLKDVYLAQAGNKKGRKTVREGYKVCRFCLKWLKKCAFNDIGADAALTGVLRKYFPEMDLNITNDVTACPSCVDRLTNNFNFIMHCLETENHIKKYYDIEGIPSDAQIDLRHLSQFVAILKSIDPDTKERNAVGKNNDENQSLNNVDSIAVAVLNQNIGRYSIEEVSPPIALPSTPTTATRSRKRKAEMSPKATSTPKTTPEKRERPRRSCTLHKCPHCTYTTEFKGSYNNHMLQHADPSELTMYKCEHCPFQTKHKGSHARHLLDIHNKKKTVYTCQECAFKTDSKPKFRIHVDSHRGGPELPSYRCEHCEYETKSKRDFKKHEVCHKKSVFSCDSCEFQTEDPLALKAHKKESDCADLKCDVCTFTTKHKGNLKIHALTHKSNAEAVMYKCSHCAFETKHKISLKTHMLRHKSASEMTYHECQVCGFKAKHKGNLKLHEVIHKDPAEMDMYKCERCEFQTKHKMSLRTHMLRHKKKSEVVRYRCEVCEFETMHKGNLKKHEMIHKDASELTWYSCHLCGFETIHKGSYKTHATSFHPPPEAYILAAKEAESKDD